MDNRIKTLKMFVQKYLMPNKHLNFKNSVIKTEQN